MLASVRIRPPGQPAQTLGPGDLIGRAWSAHLRIDDPEVSEAHALVSLRGEALWLLALRRRLRVDGAVVDAVALRPGLEVALSPSVVLVVESVRLPDAVLGLEGPGLPLQTLPGACGLVFDPHPRLAPGAPGGAAAHLWPVEDGWRLRPLGGAPRSLSGGEVFEAGGRRWRAVAISLDQAGGDRTRAAADAPLLIVSHFDTVHILRDDQERLVLTGQMARVVAELISVGQPLAWDALAQPLWQHIGDRDVLRRRWDGLLARLRARLEAGGLPRDLVSSTRIGLVELRLGTADRVDDRS